MKPSPLPLDAYYYLQFGQCSFLLSREPFDHFKALANLCSDTLGIHLAFSVQRATSFLALEGHSDSHTKGLRVKNIL
jgi:hypothetical protein